jgi:hypothetical protein
VHHTRYFIFCCILSSKSKFKSCLNLEIENKTRKIENKKKRKQKEKLLGREPCPSTATCTFWPT